MGGDLYDDDDDDDDDNDDDDNDDKNEDNDNAGIAQDKVSMGSKEYRLRPDVDG